MGNGKMGEWDEHLCQKLEQKARKAEARYADLRRQMVQEEKQRRASQWKKRVWQLFIVGMFLALMDSCETGDLGLIDQVSQQVGRQILLPMP